MNIDDRIRDGLIDNGLLEWMQEISDKLPNETELQIEIIYFIHNCLKKRNWPLMRKVMPGICTLSKTLVRLCDLFPFEQSHPDDPWREDKATHCIIMILSSFESVIQHNHDLFEQLAIKFKYHKALLNLTNYAKDLKLACWSMGIIAALCGAKRQQVKLFLELNVLTTIKSHLLNHAINQESNTKSENKDQIERIHTEACIALSNIACDKSSGVTAQLISSNIFPDAVFPLYFDKKTSFMNKHELAFCVCNSLLNCSFEQAYTLLSSGQYLKIMVDVLQL